MKILFINKFFFIKGGSEKVFFQERDFLLNKGVKVIDFSMKDPRNFYSPYTSFFVSNIDYHSSLGIFNKVKQGLRFVHSFEAVEKIERIVKIERPKLAHLHNIYHQLTPSIIHVLKKYGVKIVLTVHDGKLICPSYLMLNKGKICTACAGQYFWRPLTKRCQNSLTKEILLMSEALWHKWKKSYQLIDLFISPSRFIADLISQRISKNRIRVLHNGIKVDDSVPTFKDEDYGLYVGRLSMEKGVEVLLKAHKAIDDILPLKIVGTGPMEDRLRKAYPNVEFLGYKIGEKLFDIIAKSAFVVVPSEWYENCSMVVLEAMAMGKPIIGSRIGGIPEQVDDGKTGLLFEMGNIEELADKITALAEDKELRKELGKAGRKKLEREYSLQAHCSKLMEIYEELLQ